MEGRLQFLTFLKNLFYFEWSPPWHFKAYILTCILSMIIQIRHLTKETQHRMLWFESKPTRHKKWLAFLCLCPAARGERCRKVRHAVVEVRQCPLRSGACGWVPAVHTEIWNSQLKQGWRRRASRRWAGQLWQNLETRTWQVAGGEKPISSQRKKTRHCILCRNIVFFPAHLEIHITLLHASEIHLSLVFHIVQGHCLFKGHTASPWAKITRTILTLGMTCDSSILNLACRNKIVLAIWHAQCFAGILFC